MKTTLQRIIQCASGATQCREAAAAASDPETRASLLRAAEKYRSGIPALVDKLAREATL